MSGKPTTPPTTMPEAPEYKIVPMVSHGQELADLVRATSQGYQLIHVGNARYHVATATTGNWRVSYEKLKIMELVL
jgi:hypothetical protein